MDVFEFDAASVRGYAEVFGQAGAQLAQVAALVGRPAARAADFGASWAELGERFGTYLRAIEDEVASLAAHLGDVHANLRHTAELVTRDEANTFDDIRAIEG